VGLWPLAFAQAFVFLQELPRVIRLEQFLLNQMSCFATTLSIIAIIMEKLRVLTSQHCNVKFN